MQNRAIDILRQLRERGIDVSTLCVDSRTVQPGDVFLAYPGAAQDGPRPRRQLPGREGLGQVIVSAYVQALHFVVVVIPGADHDDGYLGELAGALADGVSVHAGHHDIQQHQVRAFIEERCQRCFAVAGGQHAVALHLQCALHDA